MLLDALSLSDAESEPEAHPLQPVLAWRHAHPLLLPALALVLAHLRAAHVG